MKISLITFTCAMMFCLSAIAHPFISSNSLIKNTSTTKTLTISDDFSVYGIQANYWIKDGHGQIEMTITTHDHLLITGYLYDVDDHEKVRAEILINNRTRDFSLPLEKVAAGNYKLVIRALNTDNQTAIKTFNIALTDFSEN
ncbi:TPA: hypothetical protein U5E31_003450 [Yersinia enterocolitica]|uniref:hypothetical protein n=1 Tax=Yersinia enterocolitica TaxID=630 RepID=UPI00094BAE28|nr:hypothetical protein [Yersinia enterocolitica]MBW5833847.1 hypothetical protein [Yersinia enterocolitica]HDL8055201.1 hypothetical protein [Yersinia enterocolitica]HDM8438761.1 hypothetical protein [Yersinia enterocolitica]HEI6850389.1 hypothetical protein [Yersinia enterocolitica]HEN3577313.1 hypothetical protein [Yersinia enterocolitica]